MFVCADMYIYICIYIQIHLRYRYVKTCTYISACIHPYKHADRRTDSEMATETEADIHAYTNRHMCGACIYLGVVYYVCMHAWKH